MRIQGIKIQQIKDPTFGQGQSVANFNVKQNKRIGVNSFPFHSEWRQQQQICIYFLVFIIFHFLDSNDNIAWLGAMAGAWDGQVTQVGTALYVGIFMVTKRVQLAVMGRLL